MFRIPQSIMISKYNIFICFSFMLKLFFFTDSSPVSNSSMLDDFNTIFREGKCKLPKQIVLENVTKISQTSLRDGEEDLYNIDFSIPLAVCAAKVPPEKNRDANICSEVFKVLNNISTCSLNNTVLASIKTSINISIDDDEICDEFNRHKSIFPYGKAFVAYTLTEPNFCTLICHGDEIRDACTLLLWAYRIQAAIYENLPLSDGSNGSLTSSEDSTVYADHYKQPDDENDAIDSQNSNEIIPEMPTFTSSVSIQNSNNTTISNVVKSQTIAAKSSAQSYHEIPNKKTEIFKGTSENVGFQSDVTKSANSTSVAESKLKNAADSTHASFSDDKSQGNHNEMFENIAQKTNNEIDPTVINSASLKNHDALENDKIRSSIHPFDSQKSSQQNHSSISTVDMNNEFGSEAIESKATTVKSKATTVKSKATTVKSKATTVKSNSITGNEVSHDGRNAIEPTKSSDPHKMDSKKKTSEPKSSVFGKNNDKNEVDTKNREKMGEHISKTNSMISTEKTKSDSMKLTFSDTLVTAKQHDLEKSIKPEVKDVIGGTTKLISSAEEVLLETMEEGNTANFNDDGNIDDSSENYTPKPEDYDLTDINQQELRNRNSESKKPENNPETVQSKGSQSVNAIPDDAFDDGRSMGGGKPFPEQEDTHFFFYFISIIAIIIGSYLLFHNKQKIIALIIEGRHEKKRRSHNISYKKLDTK